MDIGKTLAILLLAILIFGGVNSSGITLKKEINTKKTNLDILLLDTNNEYISLDNQVIRIKIWLEPFSYQVISKARGIITETLNYAQDDSLYYIRNFRKYYLRQFNYFEAIQNGVVLNYRTTERNAANISITFISSQTIKIALSLENTNGFMCVGQDIQLSDDEAIYGLMERIHGAFKISEEYPIEIGSLDRRGHIYPMRVTSTIGIYTPFYHSTNGYGLYVNTSFYGYFDTGFAIKDRLRFVFNTAHGRDPVMSYYLFYGPSHDEILDEYTALTGRPFVPPDWAFLHWRWRDMHEEAIDELDGNIINGQVAEDIKKYEELNIPVGNYWIDRPWTPGEKGFAEFAWNPDQFPNSEDMRQSLFDRGYHLAVWGGPFAYGLEEGQNGYEAKNNGYLVPGDNKYIDFTNPDAFEWWKNKIINFVLENGIQAWKLDRGDEDQPSWWWDIYWNDKSGAEMRNIYPVFYQKCYYEAMKEAWGDDFVNIARSGWSGSQQYIVVWAGDTRGAIGRDYRISTDLGLRSAIISQLHCSFMGFPIWGSDTGGFMEFRNREVFARWLQFSAFSSLMEIGGRGTHAPWDMPTKPNYDEEMIDIYRTYTKLHHDLVDYIYNCAKISGESGHPIARPLVFDYPDDSMVKDMWDEYMFGPDILVAPMWEVGEREREVYIPAGEFVDYWNPENTISGPTTIIAQAPLDRIPFYIRKGTNILGKIW